MSAFTTLPESLRGAADRYRAVLTRMADIDQQQNRMELAANLAGGWDATPGGKAEYDALGQTWETLSAERDNLTKQLTDPATGRLYAQPRRSAPASTGAPMGQAVSEKWVDAEGREVRVVGPNERLGKGETSGKLGQLLRAWATGDGRQAAAFMADLGTTSPGTHVLVPEEYSSDLIDKARNASVLVRAGAKTVEMRSDRMTIARVKDDPTFEVKAENAAFTGSSVGFDSIGLTAFTIGTTIKVSRELAADAPNFASIVEAQIAAALAVELDRLGLRGTGSQEPVGLSTMTSAPYSVPSTASVGAIDWDNLLDAIEAIENANRSPSGYVVSPAIKADLARLKDGNGMYLAAPPDVAALSRFVSKNAPDTECYVGDFSRFLIGLRQAAVVETSTVAGDAFDKHQVWFKITWRGDFNIEDPNAFHVLRGLTT